MTPEKFNIALKFLNAFLKIGGQFSDAEIESVIREIEQRGYVSGVKGLGMAVNDCIEMYFGLSAQDREDFDRKLNQDGAPAVASMLVGYSKRLARLITKDSIKSESDYYLLTGALFSDLLSKSDRLKVERLREGFEARWR